jgi:hypothetical protein
MSTWDDAVDKRLAEIGEKYGKGSEIYRVHTELVAVDRKLRKALVERNLARHALKKYGQHNILCDYYREWEPRDCSCGFDTAVKF